MSWEFLVVFEESETAYSKLDHSGGPDPPSINNGKARFGVFAHSEQIVEGDHCEETNGLSLGVREFEGSFYKAIRNFDAHC